MGAVQAAGVVQGLANAVDELVMVQRLGQEVDGPMLGGLHGVRDRAMGRDHDHGQRGIGAAQAREQFQAVHAVHAQVGDHHAGFLLGHGLLRLAPAGGGVAGEAGRFQAHGQEAAQAVVIVHQQHSARVGGGG